MLTRSAFLCYVHADDAHDHGRITQLATDLSGEFAAITNDVRSGWYIRSLHKWSANFMIVAVMLHMLRVFFTAAYRHPRELNWCIGFLLLGCTLTFGFTGYSLVYEQLSFWGATVACNCWLRRDSTA